MIRSFVLALSSTVLLATGLLGCGPITSDDVGNDGSAGRCMAGETRCDGTVFQSCAGGDWTDTSMCATQCAPDLGCVACRPDFGNSCQGDTVHACNADGSIGAIVDTCQAGQCANGACQQPACGAAAELIYVVDQDYNLLSFDPRALDMGQDPFTLIGSISCPTQAGAYSGWNNPPTPFSMSVDRDATAWVLFTNGEIFHVSTDDASCQATGFGRGQQGFELFGMGFVTDDAGSQAETLWIVGGSAGGGSLSPGDLGSINANTLTVSGVGPVPGGASYSPELTGTGDAELFAYYPGQEVARVDKATAQHLETWPLPGLGGDVRAWAFAHWGGNFYIFVTTQDFLGPLDSQVQFLDRATGQMTTLLTDQPYVIVGAGVSTCAPVVIE